MAKDSLRMLRCFTNIQFVGSSRQEYGIFRSARTSYRTFDFRPSVRPPVRAKNPDHLYSLINHRRTTVNLSKEKKGKGEKEKKGKERKKGKKEKEKKRKKGKMDKMRKMEKTEKMGKNGENGVNGENGENREMEKMGK